MPYLKLHRVYLTMFYIYENCFRRCIFMLLNNDITIFDIDLLIFFLKAVINPDILQFIITPFTKYD